MILLSELGEKVNKTDFVVKDNKRKTCHLINISIATDKNISVNVHNKTNKYKNLEIDIEKMWHLKT